MNAKKLLTLLFVSLLLVANVFADDPVRGRLNIAEEDLSPSTFPYQLRVTNGTLTDNGDGTVSLSIGGSFAPIGATYLTSTANGTLTNEVDLGSLASGFLYGTVAGGVSTISSVSALLATGATTGATSQAQAFTNGIIAGNNSPTGDYTLTQNSVVPFTSVFTGAVANTLYLKAGNVGIGTTSPQSLLHVVSAASVSASGQEVLRLSGVTAAGTVGSGPYLNFTDANNTSISQIRAYREASGVAGLSFSTEPSSGTITEAMHITGTGNVGIGTTGPTAVLHLKAGTATASTAPLKFTSGTLLGTPEAGAIEFLSDAYYATITTGAVRKTFAFLESPIFTTDITTPKVKNSGNITLDAINAAATSTVYVLNSDGTYKANLDVEGDLVVSNVTTVSGGSLQLGQDGTDGLLKLYSEQGATDYIASLYANTAMTASSSFYLPAAVPAGESFLKMGTDGVIDYDTTVLGSIATQASNNVSITGGSISGITDLAFADGGTGISSWTQYLIPYAATTTSIGQIAIGTAGQMLTSAGAGAAPAFSNNVTLGTVSGTIDAGAATSLEVPNGANPTTDAAGEIAVDSSAAPGSGIRFYGDAAYTLAGTYSKSFVILNPVATDDYPVWKTPYALTIKHVHVQCLGGTNIIGQLDEMDSNGINAAVVDSSDITATANNSVDDDGTLSNPSIAANGYVGWHTTSISGTPTSVTVTFDYVVDQIN